jgi:hypothetical protein
MKALPSLCVDADPDPNLYFDADPDHYPDRHSNDADPNVDPTPSFTHVGNEYFCSCFGHSISSIQCFTFFVNIKDVTTSIILDSILIFLDKSTVYQLYHMLGINTDSDRHALYTDPNPDPAKRCGSDLILIHNTATYYVFPILKVQ